MSRRTALLVLMLATLVVAAPALAHDGNGSGEDQQVSRSCGAADDPHYSKPTASDCRDAEGRFDASKAYMATYYSNNVSCGRNNQVLPEEFGDPTGIRVFGTAGLDGVSVGTCADGTGIAPNPVQGRVTYTGSLDNGSRLAVDGDKDNANATAQGWIVVSKAGGASVPTYSCGDEYASGGRADSDHPTSADAAAECAG